MIPWRRLRVYILVNLGLFLIGVGLVYGFLHHYVFYRYSFPLMVLLGAVMTFATLRAISILTKMRPERESARDVMIFTTREKERVLRGVITQKAFLPGVTHFRKGGTYEAKTDILDREPFTRIRVTRAVRKDAGSLTNEDALREGFHDVRELRVHIRGTLGKDIVRVTLVTFNVDK